MNRLIFLALLLVASSAFLPTHEYQRIHKTFFNVRPPIFSLNAYGNYDISEPLWSEYRGQQQKASNAINTLMATYPDSQFVAGPKYEVEYFMDSAMNSVAYIVFKQNGNKVTKYYFVRAEGGQQKDKIFDLGSQQASGVRAGRQMSLRIYTHVDISSNSSFVQSILDKLQQKVNTIDSLSAVLELKYWSFPNGTLYLLRLQNSNLSSTYFSLLHTDTFTLLGQTYLPHYITNMPLQYQFVNSLLRQFLSSSFTNVYNMFRDYSSLQLIQFMEVFMDPLYKDSVHLMVNYRNGSGYTRVLGMILKSNMEMPFPSFQSTKTVLWFDMFNYTSISQNSFHKRPYFNGVNVRVTPYGGLPKIDNTEINLTSIHEFNYPSYLIYSFQRYNNLTMFNQGYRFYHDLAYYQKRPNNRALTLWGFTLLYDQQGVDFEDVWSSIVHRETYLNQYFLLKNSEVIQKTQLTYCNLSSTFQLTFVDQRDVKKCLYRRSLFIRDVLRDDVHYLSASTVNSNDTLWRDKINIRTCQFQTSLCGLIVSNELSSDQIDNFMSNNGGLLADTEGVAFTTDQIVNVTKVNLDKLGEQTLWIVQVLKNGVTSQLVLANNAIVSYSDNSEAVKAEQQAQKNQTTNTTGTNNTNTTNTDVPLIGGNSTQNIDFTFTGSGSITKDMVQELYPELINQIIPHSGDSCVQIDNIVTYVDPLSQIVAFMLSCAQNNGHTVYELVYQPQPAGEFHFRGKEQVNSIRNPYFTLTSLTQAPTNLISAIIDSVGGMFNAGITLQNLLFVEELKFIDGEFYFAGFVLNDGTKLQGEYLCGDVCVKLIENVVEMGSGQPNNQGGNSTSTETNSTGSNNTDNNSTGNNNSTYINNTVNNTGTNSSTGGSNTTSTNTKNNQTGGNGDNNNSNSTNNQTESNSTNNQTSTNTTNNTTDSNTTNNSSTGGQSNNQTNSSGNHHCPHGQNKSEEQSSSQDNTNNNSPNTIQIHYSILSPAQVKLDTYMIPIYQAILPSLPTTVTSLNINRIEKGIFYNGTISYRVFYGQERNVDTHYLTIFFLPSRFAIIYLRLTIIQRVVREPVSQTTTSTTSTGCSNGCSHTSTTTTKTVLSSSNQKRDSEQLGRIFTAWSIKQHPQLSDGRVQAMRMSINWAAALCEMTFIVSYTVKYKIVMKMIFESNTIEEISYRRMG